MKIERSVALVTGANRGLGKAIVSALVEAGAARVYATARDDKGISSDSPRIVRLTLDITNPEQIALAAKKANDVTLLINNAGVFTAVDVMKASHAEFDAEFRTNLYGTLDVIKAFLPLLERAPGGATIVNVLSLVSLASIPSQGVYSASKAAAYSTTQALRAELKAKHIDVLAVLAGPIDTDMVKGLQIPKTSPADVAKGVLAGIARGDEDIFPDPMAQQMGALWNKNHKEYERAFASF
jgi:NAD(P)-dependent dehydrogenase (short-subunit alcohol dehydrogenase family)